MKTRKYVTGPIVLAVSAVIIVLRRVYHHLSDPAATNADCLRSLRSGAVLAVIDFPPTLAWLWPWPPQGVPTDKPATCRLGCRNEPDQPHAGRLRNGEAREHHQPIALARLQMFRGRFADARTRWSTRSSAGGEGDGRALSNLL